MKSSPVLLLLSLAYSLSLTKNVFLADTPPEPPLNTHLLEVFSANTSE